MTVGVGHDRSDGAQRMRAQDAHGGARSVEHTAPIVGAHAEEARIAAGDVGDHVPDEARRRPISEACAPSGVPCHKRLR